MTIAAKASRIQFAAMQRIAGEWVTYTDGNLSVRAKMVRGSSQFEDVTAEGETHTESRVVDWIAERAKLVDAAGAEITPRAGDWILPDAGGTYELVPGPNGLPYDWADDYEARYRLHADKIAETQ